jgi:8-oxo-dGTP pyrophosphatase MutT (NUDIX family)
VENVLDILQNGNSGHFIKAISERLKKPLPGEKSHRRMASKVRLQQLIFDHDKSNAIPSSVLILFYEDVGVLKTVFILRQTYDGVHSGQVSFPGGRMEENDKSLIETALREAQEEVNIIPHEVKILGTLSEMYIPPSNFLVLPIVAFQGSRPDFIAEESEVAQIIETDLSFLFDESRIKETELDVRGYKIHAPYFDVHGHVVWGATAMILSELKDVFEDIRWIL